MAWGLRLARKRADAAPDSPPREEEGASQPVAGPPPPAVAERPAPPVPTQSIGGSLNSVRQRLLDLYGQRLAREDFAAQAIDLITKALGAPAGALLAYEQRRDRLVLIADVGLSAPAADVLGRGASGPTWDIPMRGLTNRRISVIEAAHQNPFVPRPLIEISPRRLAIATLPFFHGYTPAGVLVLFANKPHGFTDVQLQAVGQALKVCGIAFAELPHSDSAASPVSPAAPSAPTQAAAPAASSPLADKQRAVDAQELHRLRQAFDESLWQHAKELAETRRAAATALEAEREKFSTVGAALANLETERDRLASQLSAARGELATLADTRGALDTNRAEAQRLHTALAAANAEVERTTLGLHEMQRAHDDLVERHEAAVRQHSEHTQADATERDRAAGTIAALRERLAGIEAEHAALRQLTDALQATHEQVVVQLQAMQVRAATLQEQLASRTVAFDTLDAQQTELRIVYDALVERAEAAQQTTTRLQQRLDEQGTTWLRERTSLHEELKRAVDAADTFRRTVESVSGERDSHAAAAKLAETRLAQIEKTLAEVRAAHTAALADVQQDRQRLLGELRMWGEREPAWSSQLKEAGARAEAADAERARTAEALSRLQREHQQSIVDTSGQIETLQNWVERVRAQHAELEARHGALEAARAVVQSDRDQLDALCQSLRTEQQRLVSDRDSALATRDHRITELQAQLGEVQTRFEQDTSAKSSSAKRLAKERDALVAARRELEAALAEQTARAQQLDADLSAATARHTGQRTEFDQASARHEHEAAALRQQLAETQATLEAIRRDRDSTVVDRSVTADAAGRLQRDVDHLRAELAAASDTLAQHRADSVATEAHRRVELDALQNELTATRTQMAERDRDLVGVRGELAQLTDAADQERSVHRGELERLTSGWEAERISLSSRAEELEAELERTRKEHLALAEALAVDESQPALEIERHVIPGIDTAGEPALDESLDDAEEESEATAELELVPRALAVIDGELRAAMVAGLADTGWEIVDCEPTEDAISQLAAQRLAGVAINVMAGSGWQLVRNLREQDATRDVPLLLYAKQTASAGFCFGPADCVLWPNEPQQLLDALARLVPRAKRVLAMSTDIDVVGSVREQLTGAGLSAAVMLDGKQALDLLPSVRPDAVVLHLSPACVDIFRTIAGLRANGAAPLPVVLLMDRVPTARDATFLTGGTRTLANKGTFGPAVLADAVAHLMPAMTGGSAPADEPPERVEAPRRPVAIGASDGWVG
ncbi:MAG: hypothetical protein HYR72_06010 [Deltaproteobacteria bacterium]|nr:hypothetical protein [Deltaproteobacteria bacterium]MBI3387696.1 hypothetical protein [Deltaproteobacteria bacterium]